MSELATFVELGARHITDPRGLDHVLFLLALAAVYAPRDWRRLVWVVTSFTVGHSVTLALAVTGALVLPGAWIEVLIPITIVATCIENLLVRDPARAPWGGRYRPLLAGFFGLIHGAGFANYLRSLFVERIAVPLLGFNLGLELGQLAVLAGAVLLLATLDQPLRLLRAPSTLRLRAVAVSSVVALVALRWTVERVPW